MPNALLCRREPREHLKGFFTTLGFTAIELLVFVAAVVIVTSLAIPSWNTLQERRQIAQGAEQLASFLGTAQMEAIMRNEVLTVTFARSDTDHWCVGLAQGSQGCDCSQSNADAPEACRVDSAIRVFDTASLDFSGILNAVYGDGVVSFDPEKGALLDPGDRVKMELLSHRGQYALSVHLAGDGKARICSESSNSQVPGYGLC